jgi:type II secretory pathway predicted ATPase ExeA
MLVYKVYSKDYKLKQGKMLGVLVERRKDLRGQKPLESGLKWAKVAFSSSLEKKQLIFIVPKDLDLRANSGVSLENRTTPNSAPADVTALDGWASKPHLLAETLDTARGEQTILSPIQTLPPFVAPSSCEHFYGLSAKPFELISDLDFFFMTPNYRGVLSTVAECLKKRSGVILIIGEPGVGKTTLVHFLLNQFTGRIKTVFLSCSADTFEEFLRFLLRELTLEDTGENGKDLLAQLNDHLSQILTRDNPLVLFVDEAQTLPEEVLGGLGTLSEETRQIQIALIGQPELEKKLASPKLFSLNHKIAIECTLKKLSQKESKEYIDYRLKLVGSSTSVLFNPGAVEMIIAYAQGIPRLINVACDNALLKGYFSAKRRVDKAIVREVIREKEGLPYLSGGPIRCFGTLTGFRLELSSYVQMATSSAQRPLDAMRRIIGMGLQTRRPQRIAQSYWPTKLSGDTPDNAFIIEPAPK